MSDVLTRCGQNADLRLICVDFSVICAGIRIVCASVAVAAIVDVGDFSFCCGGCGDLFGDTLSEIIAPQINTT